MAKNRTKKNRAVIQAALVVNKQPKNLQYVTKTVVRKRRKNKKRGRLGPTMQAFNTTAGAAFIRATLDVFHDCELQSVGVPDAFGGSTLKFLETMSVIVTPDATGKIAFTILPSVAGPCLMTAGKWTFTTVNTTTSASQLISNFDPSSSFAGAGLGKAVAQLPWADWFTGWASTAQRWSGPFKIRASRVVSHGAEIRYLGTELNNQGAIYASRLPGVVEPARFQRTATAVGLVQATYLQNADLESIAQERTTSTVLQNSPTFVTQTLKASEGAGGMLVLRNDSGSWDMVPYNFDTILTDSAVGANTSPSATTQNNSGLLVSNGTNLVLYPTAPWQNLDPVGVSIEGLADDVSVEIRFRMYIEAVIDEISIGNRFVTKSPAYDAAALATVARVSKGLPVMVPVTMNSFGDWWRKIMSSIGGIGRIVGGMGLPMVSQIAGGVGQISDILGSFAIV